MAVHQLSSAQISGSASLLHSIEAKPILIILCWCRNWEMLVIFTRPVSPQPEPSNSHVGNIYYAKSVSEQRCMRILHSRSL
jgi:hypothetical protein